MRSSCGKIGVLIGGFVNRGEFGARVRAWYGDVRVPRGLWGEGHARRRVPECPPRDSSEQLYCHMGVLQ